MDTSTERGATGSAGMWDCVISDECDRSKGETV